MLQADGRGLFPTCCTQMLLNSAQWFETPFSEQFNLNPASWPEDCVSYRFSDVAEIPEVKMAQDAPGIKAWDAYGKVLPGVRYTGKSKVFEELLGAL